MDPGRRRGVGGRVVEPEAVNVGLVVGRDGCLLVDCGSSPAQGALIRQSIASVTALPLVAVVVTHWHYDHAFGLAAFGDVETIGHESVPARLASTEAASAADDLGIDPRVVGRTPAADRGRGCGGPRWAPGRDRSPGPRPHRRRPARRGPGRERGFRRRPDRVVGPAVVRRRQPSAGVGQHAGRTGRADDGGHRCRPGARRAGGSGVRLRGARAGGREGGREVVLPCGSYRSRRPGTTVDPWALCASTGYPSTSRSTAPGKRFWGFTGPAVRRGSGRVLCRNCPGAVG